MTDKYQSMISLTSDDQQLLQEYTHNNTIWSEDSDRVAKLKFIITHYLTETERLIWCKYLDYNLNVNKLAKEMRVKAPTLRYYIKKISKKIQHYYDN